MHILSPVTDSCSSWISGRGRMAVEIFSWPSLYERMCRTLGSNSEQLACQADTLPIELPRPASEEKFFMGMYITKLFIIAQKVTRWFSNHKLKLIPTFRNVPIGGVYRLLAQHVANGWFAFGTCTIFVRHKLIHTKKLMNALKWNKYDATSSWLIRGSKVQS